MSHSFQDSWIDPVVLAKGLRKLAKSLRKKFFPLYGSGA
jgi:hypothetical protein